MADLLGHVNRSIPDAQFDEFIDSFATRLSGFDRRAIQELKQWVDPLTLPSDDEFPPQTEAFFAAVGRPEVQARFVRLFEQGLQRPGNVENRLGEYAAKS